MSDWELELDAILIGMDMDECNDGELPEGKSGWWETSQGATFGARKKEEVKNFIRKLLQEKNNQEENL